MSSNYTLRVATVDLLQNGLDRLQYMKQYLEKRNIYLETCKNDEDILYVDYRSKTTGVVISDPNSTCYLSNIFQLVTVSVPPTASKSSTTDVLKIDPVVVILLILGGASCSAFVAFASKPKSKSKAIVAWLENVWINFCLLFFENSSSPPSSSATRMVFTTWLLTTLLITIEVGCYLKSSFVVTNYDLIDRYQDALKYDDADFWKFDHSISWSILCSEDEITRRKIACDNLYFAFGINNVLDFRSNQRKNILLATLTELKRHTRKSLKELRLRNKLFYLGQSVVDIYVYFEVKNRVRWNQFLREELLKSSLVLMETKVLTYMDFKGDYVLDTVLWKKPTEDGTVLYMEDSAVIFKLWFYGMLVSWALLCLEFGCNFVLRHVNGKPSRHRKPIVFLY